MSNSLVAAADLARQGLRTAAYYGLGEITGRMARGRLAGAAPAKSERPTPSRNALLAEVGRLMLRDAGLVRDGICPPFPADDGPPLEWLTRVRAMMADIPEVTERARAGAGQEVRGDAAMAVSGGPPLPDYYLQNFHYQSGGYLTEESARLYDVQVETLFLGTASLMRRQAMVPLARHLAGRDQRKLKLLDVACGTGRLLGQIGQLYPRLGLTGIDLSAAYLDEARRHLGRLRGDRHGRLPRHVALIEANGEALPLPDASQDIVTTVFLFHELPAPVRRRVAREMARVLVPGGLLIFIDSAQYGDRPDWDGLLETFPRRFHEPYYRQYLDDDLDGLFRDAGLAPVETWTALLSKVVVCRK